MGDAWYYQWQGYYLAHGHGFIQPLLYKNTHRAFPGADHPPLTSVVIALADLAGAGTYFSHEILWCFFGSLSVLLLGILALRILGTVPAIVVASLAAAYPQMWMNDALAQSETLVELCAAAVLLLAYMYWTKPKPSTGVWLGALLALTALARSEESLLFALIGVPLMILAPRAVVKNTSERYIRHHGRHAAPVKRKRWPSMTALILTFGVVLAPWVVRNQLTFKNPEYLSTQLGRTLLVANCNKTYYGPLTGWWWLPCQNKAENNDGSITDVQFTKEAVNYVKSHESRLPYVLFARLGRTWGFYAPIQQTTLDFVDSRPPWASRLALFFYYPMVPMAIWTLIQLYKRRIPIFIALAPFISVSVAVLATYGTTRFRAAAEPALVLLSGMGITMLVGSAAQKIRST